MESSPDKPAATEPANLIDQIHFAQRSAVKTDAGDFAEMVQIYMVAFVCVSAIVVAHALAAVVQLTYAAGKVYSLAAAIGLPLFIALAIRASQRRQQFNDQTRGLPRDTDEQARLRCVGAPSLLLRDDPLCDLPFEPASFRIPFGVPGRAGARLLGMAVILVCILSAYGFAYLIDISSGRGAFFYAWAGAFVGMVLDGILSPTHLRVAPGRLEILHYPLFSRPRVERVNLRTARLLVDLRRWVVRIDELGREKPLDLTISLVPQRRRLAYFLFLAALSTYEAPEIAGDDLTG